MAETAPETKSSWVQIAIYLLLLFAFSSVFYLLLLRAGKLASGAGLYIVGIMWCPALAALATLKLSRRKLADLGWKWPQGKYAAMSWLIPLFYALTTYLIVWGSGLGGFPNTTFTTRLSSLLGLRLGPTLSTVAYILLAGTFGMVQSLATALGEEIGWRGFLVPELFRNVGFTGTALISGVVWSVWHYPILIWGNYHGGTPIWYSLTCFTVLVLSVSFIFAWMRLKSGSLWVGALLHASHNLYIQNILTPLTRDTGKTAWYIDEFGAVLPLVTLAVAVYFWLRRGELDGKSDAVKTTGYPDS